MFNLRTENGSLECTFIAQQWLGLGRWRHTVESAVSDEIAGKCDLIRYRCGCVNISIWQCTITSIRPLCTVQSQVLRYHESWQGEEILARSATRDSLDIVWALVIAYRLRTPHKRLLLDRCGYPIRKTWSNAISTKFGSVGLGVCRINVVMVSLLLWYIEDNRNETW